MKKIRHSVLSFVTTGIILSSLGNSSPAQTKAQVEPIMRSYNNARIRSDDGLFTAEVKPVISKFTEDTIRFVSEKSGVRLNFKMTSDGGSTGRYVLKATWTPDSKFFVFSTFSSGAHSAWHFTTFVYS